MYDLEDLIKRVKNKEENAIKELYDLTYKKAYIVSLSFMGSKDKVDDVLQNAYINIFNHIDTLENPQNIFSWVNTIVVNTCKSELRKRQNYSFSDISYDDEIIEEDIKEDYRAFIPDKNVNYEEDRKVVIGFINELPLEQRSALIMHIYEDMKISEIAKVFECSENTIKSRLNYAKKTLKEKIMDYKKKGNTLFSIPLIPYLRFILDEQYIHSSSNNSIIESLNVDQINDTVIKASDEVNKHNHLITTFVTNYWAVIGSITAFLISLTVYIPPPADPAKIEEVRLEMLEQYEVHYLNGTTYDEVINGYNESDRLLSEYMMMNPDEELDEYYANMFATSEMAPVYRAFLADKEKPDYVQLCDAIDDDIKDLVCYYERIIDNPGRYDLRGDGALIESDTLKLNYAKVLVVDGQNGVVDAGDILKEYKYAWVDDVTFSKGVLLIWCRYGNTYDQYMNSYYIIAYRIENGKLKHLRTYRNSHDDDDPRDIYPGQFGSYIIETYEEYK